jgi:hypothetical protein
VSLASDVAGSLGLADRLGVTDATLTQYTPGTRTPGALADGTNPTSTTHTCRGFERSFSAHQIDGTIVTANDRMINLFANTIDAVTEPRPNDRVTIGGHTYRIVSVERDPATVLYRCHGRR